ncbi:hypothetical protein HT031_005701 [Scenedesmus sp. PABB004]|nr:hypothetical protein HT031_005701 [Scenedesmus sp. PABB004]
MAAAGAPPAVSISCRAITIAGEGADAAAPTQQLFLLVHWHEAARRFDVSLTDGGGAVWAANGCTTVASAGVDADEAWRRARAALSAPHAAPGDEYAYRTLVPGGQPDALQLRWSWATGVGLLREVMRTEPALQLLPAGEAAAAVRSMLAHLVASHGAVEAALAESRAAQRALEASLAEKEGLLRQHAAARQEEERQLFTKFALLLNKKAERIAELTQRLTDRDEALARLQASAGGDGHDTDDEARHAACGAAAAFDPRYDSDTEPESGQGEPEGRPGPPGSAVAMDVDGAPPRPAAAAGEPPGGAAHAADAPPAPAAPVVAMLDADTLPLSAEQLQGVPELRRQHDVRQQQAPEPEQQQAAAAAPATDAAQADPAAAAAAAAAAGGLGWLAVGAAALQPFEQHKKSTVKRRTR